MSALNLTLELGKHNIYQRKYKKRGARPKSNPSYLKLIENQFKIYGMMEQCQACDKSCKQYKASGVLKIICEMSTDYENIARRFDCEVQQPTKEIFKQEVKMPEGK